MRRFLAVLMVVSLVATAAAPSSASAQSWGYWSGDCNEIDEFLWLISTGLHNKHCDPSKISAEKAQLEEDMANQTKTSVYNAGSQLETSDEQYLTVIDNSMGDSGTIAMSKAEAAAIEEIDAGGTESEVQTAAAEAVQDYYTVKQMNLADRWGVAAETVWTMENTSDVAGLSESFVKPVPFDYFEDPYDYELRLTGVSTQMVTLVNGTSYQSKTVEMHHCWDGCATGEDLSVAVNDGTIELLPEMDATAVETEPISGQTSQQVLVFDDYGDQWSAIQSKSTQMEANAQEYAAALHNASQNGELNASTYVSPATLAQEYSTDYNSTGYYSYAVGYAGAAGFAIPDLNETSLMTISTGQGTFDGLLMSQHAPDGGVWEVGTTYSASTIEGKQFVARTDGNVTEIEGSFTITSMEDEDGASVQNTTTQQFNYSVANTSAEYAELQEEIRHLQAEINEEDPNTAPGGAGGGSGGLGGLGTWGLIGVVAVVAVAALMGSSSSGRRGRR